MASAAGASGAANDAVIGRTPQQQQYLEALASDAERAVKVIEDHIAGAQKSLATARAEAKRARAEADGGND